MCDVLPVALSGQHGIDPKRIDRKIEKWKSKSPSKRADDVSRKFNRMIKVWWAVSDQLAGCIVDGKYRLMPSAKGYCRCVTCGVLLALNDKNLHGGHWRNAQGQWRPHRWMWRNVHPQCYPCNHHRSGNKAWYDVWMAHEYFNHCPDIEAEIKCDYDPLTPEQMAAVYWLSHDEAKRLEAML